MSKRLVGAIPSKDEVAKLRDGERGIARVCAEGVLLCVREETIAMKRGDLRAIAWWRAERRAWEERAKAFAPHLNPVPEGNAA